MCGQRGRIATDDQLRLLAEGKLTTGLEARIRALDRAGFFNQPMLTDMKPLISRMDGFVHGGYPLYPLQRRPTQLSVEGYARTLIHELSRWRDTLHGAGRI